MIDIFIPSYHRAQNLKTVYYFLKRGYNPKNLHVVIDDEADDIEDYKEQAERFKFNLHIFDMEESRARYDFIHRPSKARRAAGLSRNTFFDIAKKNGITFYVVIDDDTTRFEIRPFNKYLRGAKIEEVVMCFESVKEFMLRHKIGLFGLSQTGDMMMTVDKKNARDLLRKKVMNVTFYNAPFIYRGERGVQDDDTSQFVGVMNEGLFTGSLSSGIVLQQTLSATSKGGLTDLYKECKLINKAMVVPIQFPSCVRAEKQKRNGNRMYHRINYRYLWPKILKGERDNIAWDTYAEDVPFTNEPHRNNHAAQNTP